MPPQQPNHDGGGRSSSSTSAAAAFLEILAVLDGRRAYASADQALRQASDGRVEDALAVLEVQQGMRPMAWLPPAVRLELPADGRGWSRDLHVVHAPQLHRTSVCNTRLLSPRAHSALADAGPDPDDPAQVERGRRCAP